VIDGEVVGGRQISAERSVGAGDQNGTGSRGHVLLHLVVNIQSGGLRLFLQDIGVPILADAAEEHSHPGLSKNPLGNSQRILHGSASQKLSLVAFDQLPVDGHVSVLGKDRIILVHRVLLQEVQWNNGGDVQQRVAASDQDSFSVEQKKNILFGLLVSLST